MSTPRFSHLLRTTPSPCRLPAASAARDRNEAQMRDLAFVLRLTERVRDTILRETAARN